MKRYEDSIELKRELRNKIGDKIEVSDYGATITPKDKRLSPGCYSCKNGSWICIFIGTECNLDCDFCPQSTESKKEEKGIVVVGGDSKIKTKEHFRKNIEKNDRIEGVSFSGGEPFLYLNEIVEWLNFINDEFSHLNIYFWLYTNGINVTEDKCKLLKNNGINEIRFDLAATNYSDNIIDKLEYCKKIFDRVTVEVPILPYQTDKLISVLKRLDEIGVDYLNLHEIIINKHNKRRLIDNNKIDVDLIYQYPDSNSYGYMPSIAMVFYIKNIGRMIKVWIFRIFLNFKVQKK